MNIRARGLTVLMGAAALAVTALPAIASASTPHAGGNPYSPANGHAYRHGAFPTSQQKSAMQTWARSHSVKGTTAATGPQTLSYGGGIDGIGVTSGTPKVYLIFWGTQWGTQSTDSGGNLTFSSDTAGGAPYLQKMFKGLGTNNELWSGVMTQYCDGSGVANGATTCPAGAPHVGYPTGGNLSGVWYDNSAAEPTAASALQLGNEAVKAASHFGNTSAASNRYAQYVVLSPKGLNPDNYKTGGFCAWHDYNGDVGAASSVGDIAFTNMPYVMDQGASCGSGFVNSGGTLDGYSMVEGHEYAETVTDQNPAGGWTNHTTSSYSGEENADECAWISSGQGASANVALSTGTFAMQSTWSNDTNRCDISHAIVSGGGTGNTVTVTNPGSKSGTVGTATSLQITASDSASGQTLTYSATGLPTGLSINSSTGLISGTPTTAGTYSVTAKATDTTGASGTASFSWTITTSGGGCPSPGQKFTNPGFESGSTGWSATASVINTSGGHARTGAGYAWLDGYGRTHTDTLSQSVTIPAGCSATLSYYLNINSSETTTTTAYDKLTVTVGSTTVQSFSNLNKGSAYVLRTVNLSSFAGQTVTVKWTGTEDASLQTSFFIDDTSLSVS